MHRFAAGVLALFLPCAAAAQDGLPARPTPSFKAGIDVVTLFAVVHDRLGRSVNTLTASDFELVDGGVPQAIIDCRIEDGPVTLALLLDVSGSMALSGRLGDERATVRQLLGILRPGIDQVALFTFDDDLHELQPFTTSPHEVERQLDQLEPYGVTSLYDAVWRVGVELAGRTGTRGAVVALTDGVDTRSSLNAVQTARVVNLVDVPVYVIAIDLASDRLGAGADSLRTLARSTGGEFFAVGAAAHSSLAVRQIVAELRQRYVIAFEAGTPPGWHQLALRTIDRDLAVRARNGYIATAHREP